MGWRDSFTALLELFPQVDARLIKGAALEHGDDIGAAAEFILNEVLVPDDGKLDEEQVHRSRNAPHDFEQGSASSVEQAIIAVDTCPPIKLSVEEESESWISDGSESAGEDVRSLANGFLKGSVLEGTEPMQQGEPVVLSLSSNKDFWISESQLGAGLLQCNQKQQEGLLVKHPEEFGDVLVRTTEFGGVEGNVVVPCGVKEVITGGEPRKAFEESLRGESQVTQVTCSESKERGSSTSSHNLAKEEFLALSQESGLKDLDHAESLAEFPAGPVSTCGSQGKGLESGLDNPKLQSLEHLDSRLDIEESKALAVTPASDHQGSVSSDRAREGEDGLSNLFNNSMIVGKSTIEVDASLGNNLDVLLSNTSANGMDGVDCESVESNSMMRMLTIDDLVEGAKADRESLISSIEEIHALRVRSDQADSAARQSCDEAARGGLEIMARVDEMRQILSRAREANAVHKGEVYGEKAVLETEARELESRLVQVKAEKAKAFSVLNEFKAHLQARIESANHDREAAKNEKITKEALAREVLAKEEELMAKVAQESRDLDAEAEACTKLREFLIERGSIVDALQGEVAVLCEDAEALKNNICGMSLSIDGFMHTSRAGSDTFNSSGTSSGKFSEPLESLVQVEGGTVSSGNNSGSFSLHKMPAATKTLGDKKPWSSIPSLLRALSSSQDLNSSSHSSHAASASSFRNASTVNQGEDSQYLGSQEPTADFKYVSPASSQSSQTSPGVAQAEQELYEAQMAMLELEYSGSNNLDIFRSEKHELRAEADEEDWHLLDPWSKGSSRSSSRS